MARVSNKGTARRLRAEEKKIRTEDARKWKRTKDSYQNFPMNLGMGTDNPMAYSTYGFNPITRQRTLLEWIYRGSWIAGVAVDLIAEDMTREGIELETELDPDDEQKVHEEVNRLCGWEKICDAIKWGRLYGGAVVVPMIDGQDVSTPLRLETVTKGQFRGLVVFDRWMLEPSIGEIVQEPGPFVGLPKYYKVTTDAPCYRGKAIHYTRAWRFLGDQMPYWQSIMENMWSISVIERLYDRMVAFDSATTGAAQRIFRSFLRTLKLENFREAVAAGGDAMVAVQAFIDQMRRFQGQENMTVIDKEDDFGVDDSNGSVSGYSEVLMQVGQQLAGALQIPLVRLFGQSPAGLSATGDSDLKTYYDGIKKRQVRNLTMPVRVMYKLAAINKGITLDDEFGYKFVPLWQMTQKDKADLAEVVGRTVATQMELGVIDKSTSLKELKQSSHETGIFSNITDEMIEDADEEPPEPEQQQLQSEIGEGLAKREVLRTSDRWPGDLPVMLENPKNTPRGGSMLAAPYGFLSGYRGEDGDDMDVFVGPNADSDNVYVIHQLKKDGTFDEHKCMVGFDDVAKAFAAYEGSYAKGMRPRFAKIEEMTMSGFKDWLQSFKK